MSKTRRAAAVVAVFLAGALAGRLTVVNRQPTARVVDHSEPITLRRGDGPGVYLVPYAVAVDGKSEQLREKDGAELWVIHHKGARVQVAYTQQPFPE